MRLVNEALLRWMVGLQALRARLAAERGQTLAEYGLIMAFLATAVIVGAVVAFRTAIIGAFDELTQCFL